MICGVLFSLCLLPLPFMGLAALFPPLFFCNHNLETLLAGILMLTALGFLGWSLFTRWRLDGFPVPFTLPDTLITTGPYALCRAPMSFGLLCWCAALTILYSGLAASIIAALLFFVAAIAWFRFIEEQEMEIRFGAVYRRYQASTPLLFPLPLQKIFHRT